jgi:ribose transport system substrate-binding protein
MLEAMRSRRLSLGAAVAALAIAGAGCGSESASSGSGSGSGSSTADTGGGDPLAKVDGASLLPTGSFEISQSGDKPADYKDLELTPELGEKAKAKKFKIGVVMHTMALDWSQLQIRGVRDTLEKYGAEVIGIADPKWDVQEQLAMIDTMIQRKPDAIIASPTDTAATGAGFKKIQEAGIKLTFMNQQTDGVEYGKDFVTVVANEAVKDGKATAAMLDPYVPEGATVACVCFGVAYYSVDQREKGFFDYWKEKRPDVTVKTVEFTDENKAGQISGDFLTANPDIKGLYSPWDAPGMLAVAAVREQGKDIPMATMDLGSEVAIALASGGMVKGVQAQGPYDQGVGEALATLRDLLGEKVEPYYTTPGYPALPNNVLEAWKVIWHQDPPQNLIDACKTNPVCAEGEKNQPFLQG